jgi:transcriptional regulator with XRE-family HTH domain
MRWQTRIFDLAKQRKWTLKRLAQELDVAPSTLWRVRAGRIHPSRDLMWKASQVFAGGPRAAVLARAREVSA